VPESEKKSGLQAVLWDMDGTIVDTEPYWISAEFDIVETAGGTWSHEHAMALVGADLLDAGRYIREHGSVNAEPHEIVEMLLDRVVVSVQHEVPWRPGARELLAELTATNVPTALVTMSWRRFAVEVVNALPEGSFNEIVVGDDVDNGKPHPEPYLLAAQKLGVDIAHCIAIEDSPTGVASAAAAGAVVLAVPHHVDVPKRPEMGHRMVHRESLAGITLAELNRFYEAATLL
jgi:HAD superfamily hydrolase (TIGR01509 family)